MLDSVDAAGVKTARVILADAQVFHSSSSYLLLPKCLRSGNANDYSMAGILDPPEKRSSRLDTLALHLYQYLLAEIRDVDVAPLILYQSPPKESTLIFLAGAEA